MKTTEILRSKRVSLALCLTVAGGIFVALSGCTLEEAKNSPSEAPVRPQAAPPVAEASPAAAPPAMPGATADGKPVGGAPPMMGGGMDPMAPLTPTPDMDKAVADANKSGDKKKIGVAYAKRGLFRMTDAKAGAKIKYRASLSDLRKSLTADPTNTDAKQAKEQIEGIYTSMGRPIPTEDVP